MNKHIRRIALGLAASAVVATPVLVVNESANANPGSPGCVTRAEFRKIDTNGWDATSRARVTAIFGTRGHVTSYGSGGTEVEYEPCAGDPDYSWVDVDFEHGRAWFKWMSVIY